jgi:hypothetical protein
MWWGLSDRRMFRIDGINGESRPERQPVDPRIAGEHASYCRVM